MYEIRVFYRRKYKIISKVIKVKSTDRDTIERKVKHLVQRWEKV